MTFDDERGKIHNLTRYKQPVEFDGLAYGKITPTDIDGLIEYRNRVFVFYELKLRGKEMDHGQRMALQNVVDGLNCEGKYAILFKCEHDVHDAEKHVDAATAEVTSIYWNGKWTEPKRQRISVREATDSFFNWLQQNRVITPLNEIGACLWTHG